MKTKHLIIHNGRPYLADGEMPEINENGYPEMDIQEWKNTTLKDWENSLVEPENIAYDHFNKVWQWTEKPEWSKTMFYHSFNQSGQLIEVEGNKIIRLITTNP